VVRFTTHNDGDRTLVTIDGELVESDLKTLQRVRKSVEGAVVLELGGLSACAPGGVKILRTWLDSGARLQNATPFLQMVLKRQ
jgi:hypothetical protein